MTKIMTAIIAFDLLKKGEVTLDEEFPVSETAWRMSKSGYSSMFIMLNDMVSVEDLLKGIIIVSGNDACVALAEGLAGSEEEFANLMNIKAEELEMYNTNFVNSSGIANPDNYSTVRDIATMSRHLIMNYPEYYHYFKETTFTWDRTGGDPITQGNRNPLLYKNIGVDGLKTGFLSVEKYSLASSLQTEGGRRLIAVASGFNTKTSRSKESAKLLFWGLRSFDTVSISKKDEPLENLEVWLGKKPKVKVTTKEDVFINIPKRKKSKLTSHIEHESPIPTPIAKDQELGMLKIFFDEELIKEVPVYAMEKIGKVNIFSRIFRSINYLIWGDV
jgi:D-alanyl-D-alanine carboxypeptidase (penicillin-binding protein 5/6)